MDVATIVENWFSTREQKITFGISVFFLLLFPIYFANMAVFLPDGAGVAGGGGSGTWDVIFNENEVANGEETADMVNGEVYEFVFTFGDESPNLAYVDVTVSHGETDEGGSWQDDCDNAAGQMVMTGVGHHETNSVMSGSSSNNCPSSYTMRVLFTENYSGEAHTDEGAKSDVLAKWDDGGNGRGTYTAEITLTTNTGTSPGPGPKPGPASNNEQGESVTVSWSVVAYEVSVTKQVTLE